MNDRFVNAYDLTEAVYLEWATHPIGKIAKGRAKAALGIFIFELVVSAAIITLGVIQKDFIYLTVGFVSLGYFLLKRFYLDPKKHKRQFMLLKGRKGVPVWHRELVFGEQGIAITDAGEELTLDYADIREVTETDRWFCLWLDATSAYRVSKDDFTEGDPSKFLSFMITKVKEAKSKKK